MRAQLLFRAAPTSAGPALSRRVWWRLLLWPSALWGYFPATSTLCSLSHWYVKPRLWLSLFILRNCWFNRFHRPTPAVPSLSRAFLLRFLPAAHLAGLLPILVIFFEILTVRINHKRADSAAWLNRAIPLTSVLAHEVGHSCWVCWSCSSTIWPKSYQFIHGLSRGGYVTVRRASIWRSMGIVVDISEGKPAKACNVPFKLAVVIPAFWYWFMHVPWHHFLRLVLPRFKYGKLRHSNVVRVGALNVMVRPNLDVDGLLIKWTFLWWFLSWTSVVLIVIEVHNLWKFSL